MSEISGIGKLSITTGIIIIVAGLIISFMPKIPCLGKLPGDIHIKRKNFTIYFPLTTSIIVSIIVSIILTAIFLIIRYLTK